MSKKQAPSYKLRKSLRQPINFKEYAVEVRFPDGTNQVITFEEMQVYALEHKDLDLCPRLIKYGFAAEGSLSYTLIKRG
jgi:hypothetical protein